MFMNNKLFKWAIILESLVDKSALDDMNILDIEVTTDENPQDRWHIYNVSASKDQIVHLAKYIKPKLYYAHFWLWNEMIVVYPNKIFELDANDNDSWTEAIVFWLSLDIPKEQLYFSID